MCGIVYAEDFNGNPVNNSIMQIFDKQRHRGTQGFGLFDGQEMNMVHETKEDSILKWLVKYDSNQLLFHHRNPTSTINVKRAAHPFSTKDYFGKKQYIMVHNGHITNSQALRAEHEELHDISYYSNVEDGTFNDSEALLWDLSLVLEGKQKSLEAYGGIAFVCMELEKGKIIKLHFGRNNNPLNMIRNKSGIMLSSEGSGEPIDSNTLYTYHYKSRRLTHKPFTVPASYFSRDSYEPEPFNSSYSDGRYDDVAYPYRDNACRQISAFSDELEDDDDYDYYEGVLTNKDRDKYRPLLAEVESNALAYLFRGDGYFGRAYTKVEMDYYDIMDDIVLTEEQMKRAVLLEWVMEEIINDIEYTSEHARSSQMEELQWA